MTDEAQQIAHYNHHVAQQCIQVAKLRVLTRTCPTAANHVKVGNGAGMVAKLKIGQEPHGNSRLVAPDGSLV